MSSLEQTVSTTKLKLKEKIAYGLGDVGNNFLFDLGQIYLLKFYTDILGLPAIWAGSIFLVSKVFDAFADMSVGTVVDSTITNRPYLKLKNTNLILALC